QFHDIETEPEMRPAVTAAARLPERLEQPPTGLGCERRSGVVDFEQSGRCFTAPTNRDGGAGGTEVDGIVDELVEKLHDQVGRAFDLDRLRRQIGCEMTLRECDAVRIYCGRDDRRQIE